MKTDRLDGFERRLLHELKEVVAERPELSTAPTGRAARRRFGWKPRLALAAVGVAAGVVAAMATPLILDGDRTNPAFAVTPRDDGKVRVEVNALRNHRDAEDLERALEDAGIPSQVDYIPMGTSCQYPRYKSASGVRGPVVTHVKEGADEGASNYLLTWTLDPAEFEGDYTLVIEGHHNHGAKKPKKSEPGEIAGSIGGGVAEGPVAPCKAT